MAIEYTSTPTGMPAESQERMEQTRRAAIARLEEARAAVTQKTREMARYANQQVHGNPWTSVGVAFAAGTLLGVLAVLSAVSARRDSSYHL